MFILYHGLRQKLLHNNCISVSKEMKNETRKKDVIKNKKKNMTLPRFEPGIP